MTSAVIKTATPIDAYAAAERVARIGQREAVALPVNAIIAICQRLVALEHVAADTFVLLGLIGRLPGNANPNVIPETATPIEAIASALTTLGYQEETIHDPE